MRTFLPSLLGRGSKGSSKSTREDLRARICSDTSRGSDLRTNSYAIGCSVPTPRACHRKCTSQVFSVCFFQSLCCRDQAETVGKFAHPYPPLTGLPVGRSIPKTVSVARFRLLALAHQFIDKISKPFSLHLPEKFPVRV